MLNCRECNDLVENVPADIVRITCGRCVQKMVGAPPEVTKPKSTRTVETGWPKGWHLKSRFVAPDGKIYSRGKEIQNDDVGLDSKPASRVQSTERRKARKTKTTKSKNSRRKVVSGKKK